MSSGAPTTVAPVAAAAATGAQGQAVAVVDASRIAVAAARAVLLEAIVQGRGTAGVITLKTAQGSVQIRSTTPLPAGATVALELARSGEQLSARLLPVAALRAQSSHATPAAPSVPAPSGASITTAPAQTPSVPTVTSTSIGNATFGAIALGAEPTPAPRQSSTPSPPTPASTSIATSAPTSIAISAPASTMTQPAAASATNATISPKGSATGNAPLNHASSTTLAAQRAAPLPAQNTPVTAPPSLATASTDPTTPAPNTTTAASMTSRAAAVAVYAQARSAAPARATVSAPIPGAPDAGPRSGPEAAPSVQPATGGKAPASQSAPGAAPAAPRLQPGTTLEVRLASNTPQPAGPGARPAQSLPATVVGAMPQGRLVVDTPVGRLAVSVPPDLMGTPPGRTLPLEWLPETMRAPFSDDGAASSAQSTRGWPQAREVAATLLSRPEPAAREAAEQLVPKPGPRLAERMMGFIGRGDGDVARWLGEAVMRRLEQFGLSELVARAEGGAAREPDRQPGNGDWRHVTMPLFDGTMLRPIEIRARRRNGGQCEGGRDQSRFVVDCEHDALGAVQIDGLMTSVGTKKRLDVILRSHVELPEADRVALGALFADTCGAMGFGGEIAFQVLETFPVVADTPLAHRAVIA